MDVTWSFMKGALRSVLREGQGLAPHPTTMKRRWGEDRRGSSQGWGQCDG